jgi:hypothetical protein
MYKIWITFVLTLGLAMLALFSVNNLYKNGKLAGETKVKLENIITINAAAQQAIDDVMQIDLNNFYRMRENETIKVPDVTNCYVTIEWLRKLETLK